MTFVGPVVVAFMLYMTHWLWRLYIRSLKDSESNLPLPPGNVGLPFVGEMPAMAFEAAMGHDFYRRRRLAHGNIYMTHVMGRPVVRVIGAENIKAVLQAEGTKAEAYLPEAARSLFGYNALSVSNGYTHRIRRKITSKAFTTEALIGYTDALDRIVSEEIRNWSGDEGVQVYSMAERLSTRASWEVLVGMRNFQVHDEEIVSNVKSLLRGFWTLPLNLPGMTYYKAKQSHEILTNLIKQQYEDCLSNPAGGRDYNDALSLILRSAEEQNYTLNAEEVTDSIREMLIAGHSTTASALTSIVRRLAENPAVLDKLRNELHQFGLMDLGAPLTYERLSGLTYLGDVIYETLRMDPPAGGGFRKAKRTLELGGYQIPKDWTIIWSIMDTHEVSDLYSESRESFQPERWQKIREGGCDTSYNFTTFGAGARACVGKEYAKLLLRVFTVNLVRTFDWELKNPDVKMQRLPVRHPKDKLPTFFHFHENRNLKQDFDENEESCGKLLFVDDVNMNVTKVPLCNQNVRQRIEPQTLTSMMH